MQFKGIKYEFSAEPWKHGGAASWHFVSLPDELAKEIRDNFQTEERGWGRLPVTVRVGESEWKTSIFFDTKAKTYFLPLKAELRRKEGLEVGKSLEASIWI